MRLRFHTQTAGSTLTAQQPTNNVVRVALQTLAAVLGGTQSLHTNSLDEALGLPSDDAARVALRTQQIVLEETGVADVIDSLGGSYAVESLTDELETRAAKVIEHIDELGGMIAAIEASYPQREIERASYEFQQALERGDEKVVGVNVHVEKPQTVEGVFRVDPQLEKWQVASLKKRRKDRDGAAVTSALNALDNAAAGSSNLFPFILAAAKNSATIGEICATLAKRFGRYQERHRS